MSLSHRNSLHHLYYSSQVGNRSFDCFVVHYIFVEGEDLRCLNNRSSQVFALMRKMIILVKSELTKQFPGGPNRDSVEVK